MRKLQAEMRFKLSEKEELSDGIENTDQIPDYTFKEWDENPPQKFLNVGETFEFEGKTYLIDEIRTNLLVSPSEDINADNYAENSILYVYYYISEV